MSPETRAAERGAVLAAMAVSAGLIGQQVAGKAIRDALFLSAFHVSSLPGMMLASAVVSVVAALVFARVMVFLAPLGVMRAALGLAALLFVLDWRLAASNPRMAAAALYVQLALFGPVLISGFWSLLNERFDPHTAKRAVGRIGAGASTGAVTGGLLTWLAAGLVSVSEMLLGLAVISLACLAALRAFRAPVAATTARDVVAPPTSGLALVREYPYLRQLALLVGLGTLTEALVDFTLKTEVAARLAGSGALIRFFGPFHTGVGLLTLLVQSTLARRSLERFGLAATVALQPATVAIASLLGLLAPGLATAVLARGGYAVLRDSLFRSGYELLYTPLPQWKKRASKAIVDVGADKLGAILGASLALLVMRNPALAQRALPCCALAACLAALLVARRLHAGYVRSLEDNLRAGLIELKPDEVRDSTTRLSLTRTVLNRAELLRQVRALRDERAGETSDRPPAADPLLKAITDLRSGQPERLYRVLADERPTDPALVQHLIPLLVRNDLRANVVRTLRRLAPRCTGQLVDGLLDPGLDVRVRRQIPRVLRASPARRAVDGLLEGLADSSFEVRVECGLALAGIADGQPELAPPAGDVFAMVARELAAASPGERVLDHAFTLLSLALEREPLRICRIALRGGAGALRGTALEYLDTVLPEAVRSALGPHLGGHEALPAPSRPAGELADELVRSAVALNLDRAALDTPERD